MRMHWQTMGIGPNEVAAQIIGDREGIQQFVDVLMKSQKDGVQSAVMDTGNGSKILLTVRCLDPDAKLGN
jgi:hypothetical protein